MSDRPVRVRFAPSPTGPLHIGGVRTALFNYLFARKNNGTFILRIEDTDRARCVKGAEDYIIESLDWCGIRIDEGITAGGPHEPYRQSLRKDIYRKYAMQLIETGFAYHAFDTPGELEDLRSKAERAGRTFTYDRQTRSGLKNSLNMPGVKVSGLLAEGEPAVVRFKMPEKEVIAIDDVVRGRVEVKTDTLDDKILLKADGMPTYHLASVVDDHLMEISHVIRGEEWLPSTPLHAMLYKAFGWEDEMPVFVHMPLTLKPDGKGKLSKRDGDRLGFPVFPLQWINPDNGEVSSGYRESGYFPEAFVNMLALLGWNPGNEQEIYSLEELIRTFSLERIVKAGSRFDPEKAKWFNHQYLVSKKDEELASWFGKFLEGKGIQAEATFLCKVVSLTKERAFLLPDLWEQSWFFFRAPEAYDEKVVRKVWKESTPALLRDMKDVLESTDPFDSAAIEAAISEFTADRETGAGRVMNPLRLSLVGSNRGPALAAIMEVIGRREVIRRIDAALGKIN